MNRGRFACCLLWTSAQLVQAAKDAPHLVRLEVGDAAHAAIILALANRVQNDARPNALLELSFANVGNHARLRAIHPAAIVHLEWFDALVIQIACHRTGHLLVQQRRSRDEHAAIAGHANRRLLNGGSHYSRGGFQAR